MTYELFALAGDDRVDRGFRRSFQNDQEAIGFSQTIDGAALVEVTRSGMLIARVFFTDGKPTVTSENYGRRAASDV